jgi:hypothetical protein
MPSALERDSRLAATSTLEFLRLPEMPKPLALRCGICGRVARYRVGTAMVSPRLFKKKAGVADMSQFVSFTAYFRCRHCDGGGPWELTDMAVLELITYLMLAHEDPDFDTPVIIAENRMLDGRVIRYATEAEEHLRALLSERPDDPTLVLRLGNVYQNCGRSDLAEAPIRRALEITPEDAEAHAILAQVLEQTDRADEALAHWRMVLKHAHGATHLPREKRRLFVSAALERFLERGPEEVNKLIELVPRPEPSDADDAVSLSRLELRTLNLGDEDDWTEFCSYFTDPPAERVKDWRRRHWARPKLRLWRRNGEVIHNESRGLSRNDPCPCGSGRKYKRCCGG